MLKQFVNKLEKLMKPTEEMNRTLQLNLTKEQKHFIKVALSGKNVLVDACIGSGKTTACPDCFGYLPRVYGDESKNPNCHYRKFVGLPLSTWG